MKNLLILFAAAIGFAACNEEAGEDLDFTFANEVVSSYTTEQVEELITEFDPKTIDFSQLKSDLITGAIYAPVNCGGWLKGTWHDYISFVGGYYGSANSLNALFYDDQTYSYLESEGWGYSPPNTFLVSGSWRFDVEASEIILNDPMEIAPDRVMRLKILCYRSPLLIFERAHYSSLTDTDTDTIMRFKVNLRAFSHDEVETIFEKQIDKNM